MRRYATAIETVPEPCRAFGVVLRPFCLGHHLLFKRLGLPCAGNSGADMDQEGLLIAAAICAASSYEETLEEMLAFRWEEMIKEWKREAVIRARKKALDLIKAEVLFREYLKDGYRQPPINRHMPKANEITMTTPWECLMLCRLVSAGFAESEVMNGYLPARWYHYYAVLEMQQAAACCDITKWRRIFFTQDEAERMDAVDNVNAVATPVN